MQLASLRPTSPHVAEAKARALRGDHYRSCPEVAPGCCWCFQPSPLLNSGQIQQRGNARAAAFVVVIVVRSPRGAIRRAGVCVARSQSRRCGIARFNKFRRSSSRTLARSVHDQVVEPTQKTASESIVRCCYSALRDANVVTYRARGLLAMNCCLVFFMGSLFKTLLLSCGYDLQIFVSC